MQKQYEIPTDDNHIIYGDLNSSQTTDKLIIFSHGLTGNRNELHYYNAPAFFNPKGYDTFRFDYYCGGRNARQLVDCSVTIHASDLDTVYEFFKNKYKTIILIGHSLGSYVILKSDCKDQAQKVIFWDPTRGYRNLEEKHVTYEPKIDKYIMNRGQNQLLNQNMIKEWGESAEIEKNLELIPEGTSFIFAGDYGIKEFWLPYINEFEYSIIPGASHIFAEEGVLEELYRKTLGFLGN